MDCGLVSEHVGILSGETLRDIGRACDMLWLSFGKTIKTVNRKGKEVLKGTYAIHVQCSWRVVDQNTKDILFTSSDIYLPNSNLEMDSEFDWDIQGNNRFDEKVVQWKKDNKSIIVNKIVASDTGDLNIILNNRNTIEVFINKSVNKECWRFFECSTKKQHMVINGNGIEFV